MNNNFFIFLLAVIAVVIIFFFFLKTPQYTPYPDPIPQSQTPANDTMSNGNGSGEKG